MQKEDSTEQPSSLSVLAKPSQQHISIALLDGFVPTFHNHSPIFIVKTP